MSQYIVEAIDEVLLSMPDRRSIGYRELMLAREEISHQDRLLGRLERLSSLEHEQWANWVSYMIDNMTPENITRWKRQIDTPYDKLSEVKYWARRVRVL